MRRITVWALSTLTSLVLLFSYHTSTAGSGVASAAGTVAQAPAVAGSSNGASGDSDSASSSGSTGSSGSSASSGSSGSTASTTYTGDTAQTRWGPVQVQITVANGKITKSEAIVYPNGNGRDVEINSYALPILGQEVVSKQSASIDMVSGATVTSDGYLQSLQSAIDQAHL